PTPAAGRAARPPREQRRPPPDSQHTAERFRSPVCSSCLPPQLLTNTHGERLQPEVRRVPVIQLPIVARIPLVRNNEPPAVVQTSPRQPVRHARQAAATCNSGGAGLIPPLAWLQRRVVFHLQQIRPDELLDVPMLRLRVLLVLPRC